MKSQFSDNIWNSIERSAVIAVLVIDKLEHAVPLARALLDGGIPAMELTLRTPVALDALKLIRQEVPEMLAGVGTILTPAQVKSVKAAGAVFGVAPGCNKDVIRCAQNERLPFAPGIMTPSELEVAISMGCREVKLFPAENLGGVKYLRAINNPYQHLGLRYIPLGGVNAENMVDYLHEECVLALGGSWIATRKLIIKEDWDAIRRNAAEAVSKIEETKNVGSDGGLLTN